jgi:hypothetical protein
MIRAGPAVILRSPTRQSRYGDGAPEGPKNPPLLRGEQILRLACPELRRPTFKQPEQILRCAQEDRRERRAQGDSLE